MASPYYVPIPKVKIICLKCLKVFIGTKERKYCSSKCRFQFNEKKLRERFFVFHRRQKIDKILGEICFDCGKEANEIHHKRYDIPVRKTNLKNKNFDKMLTEYCKYLLPLCSKCHKQIHSQISK